MISTALFCKVFFQAPATLRPKIINEVKAFPIGISYRDRFLNSHYYWLRFLYYGLASWFFPCFLINHVSQTYKHYKINSKAKNSIELNFKEIKDMDEEDIDQHRALKKKKNLFWKMSLKRLIKGILRKEFNIAIQTTWNYRRMLKLTIMCG